MLYTQAFADNGTYTQVVEWHECVSFYVVSSQLHYNLIFSRDSFNGSNMFCFKACDPSRPNDAALCQHIFDTEGCSFNAPSNARDGVFESCAGDSQAPPGQGTAVPASSSCSTFASTDIYGGGVTVRLPGATFVPSTTATPTTSTSSGATATTITTGTKTSSSGSTPSQTQSSGGIRTITHTHAMICAFPVTALIVTFFL